MQDTRSFVGHVLCEEGLQRLEVAEPVEGLCGALGGVFFVPVVGLREALYFGFLHCGGSFEGMCGLGNLLFYGGVNLMEI